MTSVSARSDLSGRPDRSQRGPATRRTDARWSALSPLLWDVGLSLATYYGLRALGIGAYVSLMVATCTAGIRVLYVVARQRKFDGFAAVMLVSFGIALALSMINGDARFLLSKDSYATAACGLVFLGSCAIGRPLMFYLARRIAAPQQEDRQRWNNELSQRRGFAHLFTVMSVVWGVGLLAHAAISIALIYLLPIDVTAGVSTLVGLAGIAALALWSLWYGKAAGSHLRGDRPRSSNEATDSSRDSEQMGEWSR